MLATEPLNEPVNTPLNEPVNDPVLYDAVNALKEEVKVNTVESKPSNNSAFEAYEEVRA